MAKKAKVNKSQAMRDCFEAGILEPLAVVAKLKEQGIEVSAQVVSTTKSKWKASKANGTVVSVGTKGRKPAKATTGSFTLQDISAVKELAARLGGMDAVVSLATALK